MPRPIARTRRSRRPSPWVVVAALLVSAPVVVRMLAEPGSAPFLAGRAAVYAAVAVALVVAWRRRAVAHGGWRLVLLPFAAAVLYRAVWEALRIARPEPPLWFFAAGLPVAGWVLVAGVRGVVRELRAGFVGAAS